MAVSPNVAAAAAMTGMVTVGATSPLALSFADLAGATALAALGVLVRHCMDTAAERRQNKKDGMPKAQWATLDFQGLAMDCVGATFLGPALLALARWVNHIPDYAFAAVIIGAGVYGVQIRSMVWDVISRFMAKRTGG